jgi:hypothetical protein
MMTRFNKAIRRLPAIFAACALFAACSTGNTLSTTGNSMGDNGGTAEGQNGNVVIGELGSSGATLSAGNYQMTVVIGQSVGMDSLEEGDMMISNSLGAAKYLAGIDD